MTPLRLIVLTAPAPLPGEEPLLAELLARGAWRIHLRKPALGEEAMARLIERLPAALRPRLSLHDHFALAARCGIGGLHLNGRNPSLPEGFAGIVSRSCHTLAEVARHRATADYLFLSPLFDSISKQGYRAAFPTAELEEAARTGVLDRRIVALGGITPDNLGEVRRLGFGGAALLGDLWSRYRTPSDANDLLRRFDELLRAAR